jgi:hypothetical protein
MTFETKFYSPEQGQKKGVLRVTSPAARGFESHSRTINLVKDNRRRKV